MITAKGAEGSRLGMVGGGEVVGTVYLVANLPDWLGSPGGLRITGPSEKVGKVGG